MMKTGGCLRSQDRSALGDDEGGGHVGLQAAVEEVEGLRDPPGVHVVLDGDGTRHDRLGVEQGVFPVSDGDHAELLALEPVVAHVAHAADAELLGRRGEAVKRLEAVGRGDRRGGHGAAGGLASHAPAGTSVHRAKDDHGVAVAADDKPNGVSDKGLGARTAAHDVDLVVETHPQRGRNVHPGGGVGGVVARNTIDVLGPDAGVVAGILNGLNGHGERGAVRRPHVGSLPHADDARPVGEFTHLEGPPELETAAPERTPRIAGCVGNRSGAQNASHCSTGPPRLAIEAAVA